MVDARSIVELISFCLAWWLGLYLLARDLRTPQLRFTGLGLATYALALAASVLVHTATDPAAKETLARWGWPLLFLPSLFWFGSLIYLLSEGDGLRLRLDRIVRRGLIPLALLLYLVAAGTDLVFDLVDGEPSPGPLYPLFSLLIAALLLGAMAILVRSLGKNRAGFPVKILLTATLFFGLGTGLLLLPLDILPNWLFSLAIGIDLAILGVAIAMLDALGQGETLRPDIIRSLAVALLAVVIFGGQIVLVMVLSTGATLSMMVLLLAIIITAVVVQTFSDPIQAGLDRFVFRALPSVLQTRSDLRLVSSAVPRKRETLEPNTLTDEQFTRLIRRALSQMGNLPRLAASPLTSMTIVADRLLERGSSDSTLERAAELKTLLSESIERLKPLGEGDSGTTDSWRHYNALYYPYVAGLKPYSRRPGNDDLDPGQEQALSWFQSQVPERTLHNWQNAAAALVAQDIRERSAAANLES